MPNPPLSDAKSSALDKFRLTPNGFQWGPITVELCCSDARAHTLIIRTARTEIELSVTPSGKVHPTFRKRRAPKCQRWPRCACLVQGTRFDCQQPD